MEWLFNLKWPCNINHTQIKSAWLSFVTEKADFICMLSRTGMSANSAQPRVSDALDKLQYSQPRFFNAHLMLTGITWYPSVSFNSDHSFVTAGPICIWGDGCPSWVSLTNQLVIWQRPSRCVVTNCIMYYIPSIRNYISVQWYYIYTQVTLWQHVSTVNGHLQANREHF